MKDEKTITYSKDIIKSVSQKSGFPEDQVEYVFNFFFWMLKKLMVRPDITTIHLPKFCAFYVSLPMLRLKQKELQLGTGMTPSNKLYMKEELLAAEQKIEYLEKRHKIELSRMYMGIFKDQVHNSLPMLYSKGYTKKLNKKELEEFQNTDS